YAAYFVGQCHFESNGFAEALQWYERALERNPHLKSAAYGAFRALQRLGRNDEADRMLARFRDLEASPQSEVAEFRYSRMGGLAAVSRIDQPSQARPPRPKGPVFDPTPVPLVTPSDRVTWRRFDTAHPASITTADIDGDGRLDLFIAGAIEARGEIRNAVLLN